MFIGVAVYFLLVDISEMGQRERADAVDHVHASILPWRNTRFLPEAEPSGHGSCGHQKNRPGGRCLPGRFPRV